MPRTLFFAVFSLVFAAAASAHLFSPPRPLGVIKTKWFDIVYPEDLIAPAERLASLADGIYGEVAAFFGAEPERRFPVVLTPDPESANGYFTPYPHRRIVLCVAPTDPNGRLGFLADDLVSVFRHELAHAVSLSIRPAFWDALAWLFGDPAGISFYTTPSNLAEGAAIAAEGWRGYGRAVDALAISEVRQDALEGRFKSFWESAGAWDRYPEGRVPYSYGALFTKYLREEYGDALYRELWRRMGEGLLLPGLGDFLFVCGVFRQVYGIPLSQGWRDFEQWISPGGTVLEAQRIADVSYVTALAAADGIVYWADGASRKIRSADAATGRPLRIYPGDSSVSRLDVSPDGGRLLVSYLRYEGSMPRLALREVDLETGRSRKLPYRRLRDSGYAADGIAAIRADPEAASLVFARGGEERTLLPGSVSVSYASPCVSPDGVWIYALRRTDGRNEIVRLAVPEGGSLPGTVPVQRLALPERFKSIRYLSVGEDGILRFSWDDGSFYRFAAVQGDLCVFQTVPLSGGTHQPVGTDGAVCYLGLFSEGAALCSLDTARPDLGWERAAVRWEEGGEPAAAASPSKNLPFSEGAAAFRFGLYSVLPWIPPRFWFPSLRLSSGELWSVGACSVSADPAERFSLNLRAEWIPSLGLANLSAALELSGRAPTVAFELSDQFSPYGSKILETIYMGVSVTQSFPFYDGRGLGLQADAGYEWIEVADPFDPLYGYGACLVLGGAAVSYGRWSRDVKHPAANRGAGVRLQCFGALAEENSDIRPLGGLEAALFLRALPAALALDVYGACSLSSGLAYGPDGRVFSGFRGDASYPAYESFSGHAAGSRYLYADASAAPLVLEVSERLGPVYLQRFILRGGGRAAVSDEDLLYSGYARLTLVFAPLLGVYAKLRPEAWMEADYAPKEGLWTLRCAAELDY